MKKTIFAAIAAIVLTSLASCVQSGEVSPRSRAFHDSKKWGKVVRQQLDLQDFQRIEVHDCVDIRFTQSPDFSVEVEGNEKVIDQYTFIVERDSSETGLNTLTAYGNRKAGYSDNSFNPTPAVRLHVSAPDLDQLALHGAGDIDLKGTVKLSGNLLIILLGAGDVDITDLTCHNLYIRLQGAGDVDIRKLRSNSVTATINGAGDISLRKAKCKTKADFSLYGAGDIDADITAPTVTANCQGAGDIDLSVECDTLDVSATGSGDIELEGTTRLLRKQKGNLGGLKTKALKAETVEQK